MALAHFTAALAIFGAMEVGQAIRSSEVLLEEASMSFAAHQAASLKDSLVGMWHWKQWPLVLGVVVNVEITSKEVDPTLDSAEDAQLEHYAIDCSRCEDFKLLTVTKMLPFEGQPGLPMAELTQRQDLISAVRQTGTLSLGNGETGVEWALTWADGSIWTRGTASEEGDGSEASKVARAKRVSQSLVYEWWSSCQPPEYAGRFVEDVQIGSSIGGNLRFGGLGGSVDLNWPLAEKGGEWAFVILGCMLDKMKSYALQIVEGKENATLLEKGFAATATFLDALHKPTTTEGCRPSVGIGMSFCSIPVPPFIWPTPYISVALYYSMSIKDIFKCAKAAGADTLMQEAASATPSAPEAAHVDEEARSKLRPISMSGEFSQGPNLNLVPYVALGWNWCIDVSMAVSIRQVTKALRSSSASAFSWLPWGQGVKSKCQSDREDYFRQVQRWSQLAAALFGSTDKSCQVVHGRFAEIMEAHHEVDYVNYPYSIVPYVEQLGGTDYSRNDVETYEFGGAYAYVGMDGVAAGIYRTASFKTNAYKHACRPFQDFVNHYQTRVVPSYSDVLENDACFVDTKALPALDAGNCNAVSITSKLPAYPELHVDRDGKIEQATASQCVQCMTVQSAGLPCSFCPRETSSIFFTAPTCKDFSAANSCLETLAHRELNSLDAPEGQETEPLWVCAKTGGVINYKQANGRYQRVDYESV